jgi:hypothetical protein
MPGNVQRLAGEPLNGTIAGVIHGLRLSVTLRRRERPLRQARYYDFNAHNEEKRVEKLR